jgi:hypothetical protein
VVLVHDTEERPSPPSMSVGDNHVEGVLALAGWAMTSAELATTRKNEVATAPRRRDRKSQVFTVPANRDIWNLFIRPFVLDLVVPVVSIKSEPRSSNPQYLNCRCNFVGTRRL